MIGPQRLLPDRQGAKTEGLSLGIGALATVQLRQVIKALGGIRVIGPQRLLPDRQSAKKKRLGLGIGALAQVQHRKVVEAGGGIWVIGPVVPLRPGQLLLLQGNRLLKLSLLIEGLNLLPPRHHLRRHLRCAITGLGHQRWLAWHQIPSLHQGDRTEQQHRNDQQTRA